MSGIVVGSVDYGDNDKILNVFTLEKGMVSARIKGVKKAGAKLKFAAEPFCFNEYVFTRTGDKRTVIGASLIDSFYPIRQDLKKLYSASAMTEFVREFCKEEIVSPELFSALVDGLKGLAYIIKFSYASSVTQFFVRALAIVGYGLNLSGCVECGGKVYGRTFFDYNSGGFYCENCYDGKGREINNITYRALRKAEKKEGIDEEMGTFALRLIDFYLTHKAEVRLKSLKQLLLFQIKDKYV